MSSVRLSPSQSAPRRPAVLQCECMQQGGELPASAQDHSSRSNPRVPVCQYARCVFPRQRPPQDCGAVCRLPRLSQRGLDRPCVYILAATDLCLDDCFLFACVSISTGSVGCYQCFVYPLACDQRVVSLWYGTELGHTTVDASRLERVRAQDIAGLFLNVVPKTIPTRDAHLGSCGLHCSHNPNQLTHVDRPKSHRATSPLGNFAAEGLLFGPFQDRMFGVPIRAI